ncbi:hypothetical protein [Bordetella genomosp. 9]|uniref:hypothetical protein n=1 Tax=Bordetella genomosp. 9 TaxID=1416803 RepID=UPI000A32176E|nr:hypothetical protein [Bordetella genomosp. 9]
MFKDVAVEAAAVEAQDLLAFRLSFMEAVVALGSQPYGSLLRRLLRRSWTSKLELAVVLDREAQLEVPAGQAEMEVPPA